MNHIATATSIVATMLQAFWHWLTSKPGRLELPAKAESDPDDYRTNCLPERQGEPTRVVFDREPQDGPIRGSYEWKGHWQVICIQCVKRRNAAELMTRDEPDHRFGQWYTCKECGHCEALDTAQSHKIAYYHKEKSKWDGSRSTWLANLIRNIKRSIGGYPIDSES